MASAEQLLNEAQYAFQNISSGESKDNRRNASRARSLCRKIIRKFPTSTEADSAHAILKRLGDEAYTSRLDPQHRDSAKHTFNEVPSPASQQKLTQGNEAVVLDWGGLLHLIFNTSKSSLAVVGTVAFVLFAILGPFILFPLIALVLFTGPFKQMLKPKQRQKMNQFITRANAYVEERRKTGG
jgi:hypothetical protein